MKECKKVLTRRLNYPISVSNLILSQVNSSMFCKVEWETGNYVLIVNHMREGVVRTMRKVR